MKFFRLSAVLGLLLGGAAGSHATIIGFGQLGGSNTTIPAGLASNATAAGNGYVVTNGTTANIALTWDANWDIHTSTWFTPLEDKTVGGGAWDNEGGGPRIAQLDTSNHTIDFTANPGYALVLNSFDFGHTAEGPALSVWELTLTNSSSAVVWSETLQLDSRDPQNLGLANITVSPNFTGLAGESYKLTFNGTTVPFAGRHGIDNLSFNEVAVPEPGAAALLSLAGMALLSRRRK